jgi:CheY-like chemotaxis protein
MPASKVLVIDDQPINVQLLQRKLERDGIHVIAAYNGREGLRRIRQDRPDLVLLDVMMPDMDGIEVCQLMQKDEAMRSIPVIFITARTTKESKLEGLGVGAVDYITKPIDLDETLARVQTQLRIVSINRQTIELQRRLEESRRSATIGAVTEGIAHNLNNLLGTAIGYIDLIKIHHEKPEHVKKILPSVETAVQRIVSIVRQLSSLVVNSRPPLSKAGLGQLLEGGIARFHADFKLAAPVDVDNPLGDLQIESNTEVFEEVLSKVLINAWESYDGAPPDKRPISVRTRLIDKGPDGKVVEIQVDDKGHGVDPEIADQMFEPFVSSKHTVGVGMGLTVARHALRNLGGDVTVASLPGGGARATLLHPTEWREPKNRQA